MNTQPPEQNPNDYDEVTRLRLQLHHAEVQRDAFAAALKTDVLKIAKVAIYQASMDAGKSADADAMGCMAVELDDVKAENARLEADLQMEKENEDRLVRNWQHANNEVHGLKAQVAALIDEQTRLKAEVERLSKAGIAMGMCLPDTDEANAAYRAFERIVNGGRS
jgi:chromosome segregation ATPase